MTMMLPPPDLADRDAALAWLAEDAPALLHACRSACHEMKDEEGREALACVLSDLTELVTAAAEVARSGEPMTASLFYTDDPDWSWPTRELARMVEAGFGGDFHNGDVRQAPGFALLARVVAERLNAEADERSALRLPRVEDDGEGE